MHTHPGPAGISADGSAKTQRDYIEIYATGTSETVREPVSSRGFSLDSISFYHCGHQRCAPGHSFGPAVRDHYLIHYVVSGRGEFHMNGQVYHLGAGDGFLITPYRTTFYAADPDDPWEYYWMGFLGADAAPTLALAGLSGDEPVFHYRRSDPLEESLRAAASVEGYGPARDCALRGYLFLFLAGLLKNNPEAPSELSDYRLHVERAVRYIREHYFDEITVEMLARVVGISRSHLYRVFMAELRMSVQEYLLRFRLHKARHLLRTTVLPISEIAASCGFTDPSYFSRSFRRIYGESPLGCRRTPQSDGVLAPDNPCIR